MEGSLSAILATFVCCTVIAGLFWLDRKRNAWSSPALWIPQAWFMLACSRPVSAWFSQNTEIDLSSISAQISEGSSVDRAVGAGLLILGLIVLFSRRHKVGQQLRHCWPIVIFLLYCLVSLTWSDFPDVAFKRLTRVIGDWAMILVVWTDPKPINALMRLLARTAYTLIPLSVLFVKYYPLGRTYGYWSGETSYIGVTEDKNTLGAICLLFGVASVWHMFNHVSDSRSIIYRNRRIVVHIVILAMVVYLLAKADSVTSLTCGLLVTFVLWALRWRVFARKKRSGSSPHLGHSIYSGTDSVWRCLPGSFSSTGTKCDPHRPHTYMVMGYQARPKPVDWDRILKLLAGTAARCDDRERHSYLGS